MQQTATVYLIADGGHARLILRHGRDSYETIRELAAPHAEPVAHDQRTRVFQSSSGRSSSAVELKTPRQRTRTRFLAEVAKLVNETAGKFDFADIVLVAPPRALASIRQGLDEAAQRRVCGEIAKDLTKLPESDLRTALDLARPLASR